MASSSGGNISTETTSQTSTVMKAQLVIECDKLVHEAHEGWQHDQTRDAYMISQGLRVLRFSNEEVLSEIEAVVNKIATALFLKRSEG